MPAPMRPLLAARPDAYTKLIDLSLWQRATDRNDVFDTNLIPEVIAGPLSGCGVVWIITQADPSMPAHEQGPALAPGPVFAASPAFSVPRDLVPASGALAVQSGSGDQGGAVSAAASTRRVSSRRA
jgi:mannosyltransferase